MPELAARVGKSQWAVYRVEAGRVSVPVDLADALAEACAVPLDSLLWSDPLAEAAA